MIRNEIDVECQSCGTTVFRIGEYGISVSARHHGVRHVSVYPFLDGGEDATERSILLPDGRIVRLGNLSRLAQPV